MKIHCFIFALVITFLLPGLSHSAIFCVSDATELQNAITTAASNGEDDTIQIEQGTYVGNFIYASLEAYNLTIEGGYTSGCTSRDVDPANTVLDANNSGSVLVLSSPTVSPNLVLDGIKIQNGYRPGHSGAGLYVLTNQSLITVSNCYIYNNNESPSHGSGIHILAGDVTIANSIISHNSGNSYEGAGIYVLSDEFTMNNTTVTHNDGGGLYISTDLVTLSNNNISNNFDTAEAGGVFIEQAGTVTLTHNTIIGNETQAYGGGGYIKNCDTVTLLNNTISNNNCASSGGGIAIRECNAITLSNNRALSIILLVTRGVESGGLEALVLLRLSTILSITIMLLLGLG